MWQRPEERFANGINFTDSFIKLFRLLSATYIVVTIRDDATLLMIDPLLNPVLRFLHSTGL